MSQTEILLTLLIIAIQMDSTDTKSIKRNERENKSDIKLILKIANSIIHCSLKCRNVVLVGDLIKRMIKEEE